MYCVAGAKPGRVYLPAELNVAGRSCEFGWQDSVYPMMTPFRSACTGGLHENSSDRELIAITLKFTGGAAGPAFSTRNFNHSQ